MPIRILHFADIHVGMENYGKTDPRTGLSSRVVDFLHRLDEMIEYARENDVDLTIFAGDAFKTRSPNPTYQREFAYRIRDLAELAPIVLLIGNHDVPPTVMKASSVEIYDTLEVPNVWVAGEYEVKVVETKSGPIAIGTAPYPMRARILEHIPTAGMTIKDVDNVLQEQLVAILDNMAEEADQHDMPRILTGHFTIGGALKGSERGIMLGRDINLPKAMVADARWDYVALGHIHKHQNMTAGRDDVPPMVYSGSMERIDFGEEGDPKGFCWVEVERGQVEWQFIQNKARPFVTIQADLREDLNPTQTMIDKIQSHNLKGAIVRVLMDFTPESEARFNEAAVQQILKQAGAFYIATIRKDVEQPTRIRLGMSPEGLTHMELLERYLKSLEIPPERRSELLETAEDIMNTINGR